MYIALMFFMVCHYSVASNLVYTNFSEKHDLTTELSLLVWWLQGWLDSVFQVILAHHRINLRVILDALLSRALNTRAAQLKGVP